MKSERIMDAIGKIDDELIYNAVNDVREDKRNNWWSWMPVAACICAVCLGFFAVSHFYKEPVIKDTIEESIQAEPESVQTIVSQESTSLPQEEEFIDISTLFVQNDSISSEKKEQSITTSVGANITNEQVQIVSTVPIGTYNALYETVNTADREKLSQSIGKAVPDAQDWYYVSGHTDAQYLIHSKEDTYSLWKFICFDSDKYSYKDVLELVYQIDSAEMISEINVRPPEFNNTDSGLAIQAEIEWAAITDRNDIETFYDIISSMTCYGDDNWDKINYSNTDASVESISSLDAVWLGRYLTFATSYGNDIDGLKYTAVSNMFYEFSGIAYEPLTDQQAAEISRIFKIVLPAINAEKPMYKEESSIQPANLESKLTEDTGIHWPNQQVNTNEYATMQHEMGDTGALVPYDEVWGGSYLGENNDTWVIWLTEDTSDIRAEIFKRNPNLSESSTVFQKADYTLNYLTQLLADISNAMGEGQLPFVSSAALREEKNRVQVHLSEENADFMAKVQAFDTLGGAIEFVNNDVWLYECI